MSEIPQSTLVWHCATLIRQLGVTKVFSRTWYPECDVWHDLDTHTILYMHMIRASNKLDSIRNFQ